MCSTYSHGEMYYAGLNPVVGSEQGGKRPVLVLQNNTGNKYSPTVIVAPITTQVKKEVQPTHVIVAQGAGLTRISMVMLEQIRTIDRSSLGNYLGRLNGNTMRQVDKALEISVGLREPDCGGETEQREDSPDEMVLTLCPVCLNQFMLSSEHIVRRVDRTQTKEPCMYCEIRDGYDYRIIHRKKRMGDDRL